VLAGQGNAPATSMRAVFLGYVYSIDIHVPSESFLARKVVVSVHVGSVVGCWWLLLLACDSDKTDLRW